MNHVFPAMQDLHILEGQVKKLRKNDPIDGNAVTCTAGTNYLITILVKEDKTLL